MTIKQQGGIFGRNPTFNDVEVDSTLKTDGIRYDPTQDGGYGGSVFVRGGTASGGSQGQLFGGIAFGSSDRISTAAISAIQTGSNNDNVGLAFYTHPTNPQNDAAIKAFDVTHTGNIAFPSGQGIDFSATSGTGTSELFSDYEEGSFTPTITSAGTAPTVTYSNQTGKYTKVGNRVHVDIYISTSAYTAGTGNFRIAGLPFTAASGAEGGAAPMGFRVNTSAEARLKVEGGNTYCQLLSRATRDTSTGWGNAQSSIWGTANPTILTVSFTYVAA